MSSPGVEEGGCYAPCLFVTVLFERVGIDTVGPLSPSSSCHKYILLLVHYATWYPEAVLLRNIWTDMVAWELTALFSRIGFPKQVVMDQEAHFMSEAL